MLLRPHAQQVGECGSVDYARDRLIHLAPQVLEGGIGAPLTLTDPNAADSPQHFYRIILPPQ